MTNRANALRIKKSDRNRVLITETLPAETPIIFSNDGLYRNVSSTPPSSAVWATVLAKLVADPSLSKTFTVPMKYKIRKGIGEYRQLSLIHPISQIQMKEFYKEYDELILHFCSRSPISIRSPLSVASTYYRKASWENIYQYRSRTVAEQVADPFARHSPSYFTYKYYNRVYRFYESQDFIDLEKRFSLFWTLDVSKCFDSIYTHSMSWALKEKAFTKRNVSVRATFAQAFDGLMQRANHNETHGIVIGPEISRIFAELILQTVDRQAVLRLKGTAHLDLEEDYAIRRYVDDVYIFAKKEPDAQRIYDTYADSLASFSLQVNNSKKREIERPFITDKSRLIRDANEAVVEFTEKFLQVDQSNQILRPLKIHDREAFTKRFIQRIRSICSHNRVAYDEIASYLISALNERAKKFANVKFRDSDVATRDMCCDAVIILLDVMFFLYSVSPSVNASYRLCTAIVVLIRFTNERLRTRGDEVKERIYQHTEGLLGGGAIASSVYIDGLISLEALNPLLAARELGENYLLPPATINGLFAQHKDFSYFAIVSCLYYIRSDNQYREVRVKLINAVDRFFSSLDDIQTNTAKACLFLDLMSCPFIRAERKSLWIRRLHNALNLASPNQADIQQFIRQSEENCWFVDWSRIDLLTALEKKELMRVY